MALEISMDEERPRLGLRVTGAGGGAEGGGVNDVITCRSDVLMMLKTRSYQSVRKQQSAANTARTSVVDRFSGWKADLRSKSPFDGDEPGGASGSVSMNIE